MEKVYLPLKIGNYLKKIKSSSIKIFFWMVLISVSLSFREILIAYYFGANRLVDIYILVYLIFFLTAEISGGALELIFIPAYICLKNEALLKANALFSFMQKKISSVFIIFSVIFTIAAGMYYWFRREDWEAVRIIMSSIIFLPFLFLVPGYYLRKAFLNSYHDFIFPLVTKFLGVVIGVVFIICFNRVLGIIVFPSAVIIGALVQILLLSYKANFPKISYSVIISKIDRAFQYDLGKQFLLLIVASGFAYVNLLVDSLMAVFLLPEGSAAVLNYAGKIPAFFGQIFTYSLSMAVFPLFSHLAVSGKVKDLVLLYKKMVPKVILISIFVCFMIFLFSPEIIKILYQRGRFTVLDSLITAKVLRIYIFQFIFLPAGVIGVRILNSLSRNKEILIIALFNFFSNIILNFIFINLIGIQGIALATSIVFFLSFLIVWRKVGNIV